MPASPSESPATPPATAPASGGVRVGEDFSRQLFPGDNWWNQDITNAPVDPQSDAFISFVGRTRGMHPDFGPPPYGIPYVGVSGSEPRTRVAFVDYGSESDEGARGEAAIRFQRWRRRSRTSSKAARPEEVRTATGIC